MKKTLTNIIYIFFSSVLGKFLGVFTSFFVAKFLQPSNYGVWVTLSLITSYAPIICLGSVETLVKMYPFYMGCKEFDKAKEIENGVLGSIVLSTFALLILGSIFIFFFTPESFRPYRSVITVMLFTAVTALFSAFFYYRFAAHSNFKHVSYIESFRSILRFLLLVFFSWNWGLLGATIGLLLHELLICIYSGFANNKICGKLGFNFNKSLLIKIIKIGFPITIVWWVFVVQSSVNRMISISMLGKTATGHFGFGVSIISMLVLIPAVVAKVLYPKINEGIGKNLNQDEMALLVIKSTKALDLIISFSIGVLILFLPIVFLKLLPKYSPGLLSAQILLLGSFFVCTLRNGANFLIAIDKQNLLLKYFIISLICNIVMSYSFIKLGLDIEGLAISTGFSGFILASLVWRTTFEELGQSKFKQFKSLLDLYLPWFLLIGVLFVGMSVNSNILNLIGKFAALNISLFIVIFLLLLFCLPFSRKIIKEMYLLIRS